MDESQYQRLLDFVLGIKEDQDAIKEIAIRNTVILEEHMRRTEMSEKRLEVIESELEPVKDHVKAMGVIVKILAGVIGVAASLTAIVEVIRNLQSM